MIYNLLGYLKSFENYWWGGGGGHPAPPHPFILQNCVHIKAMTLKEQQHDETMVC